MGLKLEGKHSNPRRQVWRKYGFVLLWAAVGLDLIISVMGWPFLGQAVSAVCVLLYLFDHVSISKIWTDLIWFAFTICCHRSA